MKLELSLHASKLKNVEVEGGLSDPFAVVTHIATTKGAKPKVLGKTEVIRNTLNPQWVKVFEIDHELGCPTKLAVSIYDENKKKDNKIIGCAVFDIDELLGARGSTKAKQLKQKGTIFATLRKAKGSGLLRFRAQGIKLKNVEGWIGKSDPFFELSRKTDTAGGQTWDNVFRSETVKNNLNPKWEPSTVELRTLCGGELDLPIKVSVFDFESKGAHVAMGSFETSVNGLLQGAQSKKEFTLLQKGKNVGSFMIVEASIAGVSEDVTDRTPSATIATPSTPARIAVPETPASTGAFSFVDYIAGGCELNVMIAIDFTGSNGDPRLPGTLHYLHREKSGARNDYEKAITSILSILSKYDSDQMYPVVGFGAKYGGVVRHCFQCGPTAEVHGIDGVLKAYQTTFSSGLTMSGPTVFTEVIESASQRAIQSALKASQRNSQAYTILLIVTDGAVSDPVATAEALRRVGDSPLSVVIVGVGNADFTTMQFLDDCNRYGQRDLVQFVEFNKHSQNSVELTKQTLHEIPDQLVSHFQSRGIAPLPPVHVSEKDIVIDDEEDEIDLSLDIRGDKIVVTRGGEPDGLYTSR